MISVLISIAALATGITALISAKDIIFLSGKMGFKNLTKAGKVFCSFIFLLIVLPPLQDYFQRKESKENVETLKREQEMRDNNMRIKYDSSVTAMKKSFDSSNKNTLTTIGDVLAKYGLGFDSSNKRLVKLIMDSSKVIESKAPVVGLLNIRDLRGISYLGISNNRFDFAFTMSSMESGSTNFNLTVSYVIQDSIIGLHYLLTEPILDKNNILSTEVHLQRIAEIPMFSFDTLYVWLKGTYTNINRNKIYPLDEVYWISKSSNASGVTFNPNRKRILSIVKRGK